MTTITATDTFAAELEEARILLGAAIADRGEDYVYNPDRTRDECRYLEYEMLTGLDPIEEEEYTYPDFHRPTGPSCIVGHVLVNKGVEMVLLTSFEGVNAEEAASKSGAFQSKDIIEALNRAQIAQDDGKTWGDAVAAFEDHIAAVTALREDNAA